MRLAAEPSAEVSGTSRRVAHRVVTAREPPPDADVAGLGAARQIGPVGDIGALGTVGLVGTAGPVGEVGPVGEIGPVARERGWVRSALGEAAARMLATRGWERLGFARASDYARERAGLSARTLYDLARTHERMVALPHLRAELAAGRLSWTQVRLVARVATPADEQAWLATARCTTATELEKLVRRVDRGSLEAGAPGVAADEVDEDGFERTRKETFQIRCAPRVNGAWCSARQLAQRSAGERLSPPAVLELVVAEVVSAFPLDPPPGPPPATPASAPAPPGPPPEPLASAPAPPHPPPATPASAAPPGPSPVPLAGAPVGPPAHPKPANPCTTHAAASEQPPPAIPPPPRFLRPFLKNLADADAFVLDARLRGLVALEQRLDVRAGALIERQARRRSRRGSGLPSMESFARERLGMSPRKARALLRLQRAGRACPELSRAYARGRLSWVKAQVLLPLLTTSSRQERLRWLARAGEVTVRRLEDDVDRALLERQTRAQPTPPNTNESDARPRTAPPPPAATPPATTPPLRQETGRLFIVAPRDVTRLARAALCTVRRRIERLVGRPVTEGEGFEAMLDYVCESWGHRDTRVRKEHRVFHRDGWLCVVPGCSSRRNLHAHHVQFASQGGSDADENLVTLCAFHHLRGVHARRLTVKGRAPDGLTFELGVRPGRRPLARYASGDVLLPTPPS